MKKIIIVTCLLISTNCFASETCDKSAYYAGLGFIDEQNHIDQSNRIQEIKGRYDDRQVPVLIAGMNYGRALYKTNPSASQGEIERKVKENCGL